MIRFMWSVLTAFQSTRFRLVSPYTPEQCAERLRAAVAEESAWFGLYKLVSGKLFWGKVSTTDVRIQTCYTRRNALRPTLVAGLEGFAGGTLLVCRIGLSTDQLIIRLIVSIVMLLVGILLACQAIAGLVRGEPVIDKGLGALFIPTFVVLCSWHEGSLVRSERESLEMFLFKTLNARKEDV